MSLSDARITLGDFKLIVSAFMGSDGAEHAFASYLSKRGPDVDDARIGNATDIRFVENLLKASTGIDLNPLVDFLLSERGSMPRDSVVELVRHIVAEVKGERDLRNQAVAASTHAIAFFDADLRLTAWNSCGMSELNLAGQDFVVGGRLEDYVRTCAALGFYGPGQIEDLTAARLSVILDTTTTKRLHSTFSGRTYEVRSTPMPHGGLCLLYVDVTRQIVAEDKLEAANETLERRVRERTEELESLNAALAQAKAEAEDANTSKTRFLAAASHDLLQPLNAARLYATTLKERVRRHGTPDDTLMLALNVEDSLEAVEEILTALLDISQLDAGAMKAEITTFRADDILRQLRLEFEPVASDRGLALTFVRSTMPIVSDRRLLRRLLQNLISNAIKYTQQGRVIVGVRREACRSRIEIWDTGIGIPKSKQSAIFREFERLPAAVMAAPGVGLGLSIVHRLGRVLGHEIEVRSKPGLGSVFSVHVPTGVASPSTHLPMVHNVVASQRSLDGLVVVAIDNEPTILTGMRSLLDGWNCVVVVGRDAVSVDARLRTSGLVPDVIIADFHLDEADGIAAIDLLRTRYGHCRAVLVTADRGAPVREQAQHADIRVLNKPLRPAALRSLLSQWRLVKAGPSIGA